MPLTGPQLGRIHQAVLAAFDRDELTRALLTGMNVDFDQVVAPDDFATQAFALVRWADRQKRIPELVKCLHEGRPADAELSALAAEAPGWAAGGAAAPVPGGPAPAPAPIRRAGWIAAALAAAAVIAVALLVWRAWSPASPAAPSVPEAMAAATATATPTATPALNAADAVTGGAAGATADATVVSLFGNWIATAAAAQATMAAAPAATPDATVAAVVNEILARATATPTPTVTPFGRPPVNGAGFSAKLWQPGRTLRVRFLGGDPQVQARVAEIAQEWAQYANIAFAFGDDPDAEIRIAFDNSGSWAYLGTDALQVPQDDPTMNFGWLGPETDEDTFRWTVLREFGHALGLGNEHQNPNADIPWDEAAVIAFYTERYGWSEQQVRANVLTRHSPDVLAVPKPFDRASVMMFAIPNDQTVGDYEIEGNNPRLSPLDRQSVAALYPRAAAPAAAATPTSAPLAAAQSTSATAPPAPAAATAQAGDTWAEPISGITFVRVPAGEFIMGSDEGYAREKPQHRRVLGEYSIGLTELTDAQFRPFVEGGGYDDPSLWTEAGWQWRSANAVTAPLDWPEAQWSQPDHPVVGVSWYEAVAYANWLSRATGREFRLPSDAEWEKAARGPYGNPYPWGDKPPDATLANFDGNVGHTTAAGSYPAGAGPYGALDMAGNVWEWTSSLNERYPYDGSDGREDPEAAGDRTIRGGSYVIYANGVRSTLRDPAGPDTRQGNLGFRLMSPGP